jgi:hypothetical protein
MLKTRLTLLEREGDSGNGAAKKQRTKLSVVAAEQHLAHINNDFGTRFVDVTLVQLAQAQEMTKFRTLLQPKYAVILDVAFLAVRNDTNLHNNGFPDQPWLWCEVCGTGNNSKGYGHIMIPKAVCTKHNFPLEFQRLQVTHIVLAKYNVAPPVDMLQPTGSHLCGNAACSAKHHLIWEPLPVNISRQQCHNPLNMRGCGHTPRCLLQYMATVCEEASSSSEL